METFGIGFNKNKKSHIIQYLAGLNSAAVEFELLRFRQIHPNGRENLKDILKDCYQEHIDPFLQTHLLLSDCSYKDYSGVYAICFNKNTFYIGETTRSFQTRLQEHIVELDKRTHPNKAMQKQYEENKEVMAFYILEKGQVYNSTRIFFKIYCLMREQYYQELLYNNNKSVLNIENSLKKLYGTDLFWLAKASAIKEDPCKLFSEPKESLIPYSLDDIQEGKPLYKSIECYINHVYGNNTLWENFCKYFYQGENHFVDKFGWED